MSSISSLNEKGLLLQLAKGNEVAFTEIYNQYWGKLFTIAANKLNNLAEAEELVQDIFLDIWKRKSELQVSSNLDSYLAVAVKYKIINILAKRNHQQCYSLHIARTNDDSDFSTEQWLSFEDLKDRLSKMVAKLPEKCQLVFKLSRDEGLSQKEIAAELNISEKTVESHISKAINTLRNGLQSVIIFFF